MSVALSATNGRKPCIFSQSKMSIYFLSCCHVFLKTDPPQSFTYRQQLCLSGKRAAGGSQFEGKSTWDAEGL